MKRLRSKKQSTAMMMALVVSPRAEPEDFDLQKDSLADRISYHRAIEAAVYQVSLR